MPSVRAFRYDQTQPLLVGLRRLPRCGRVLGSATAATSASHQPESFEKIQVGMTLEEVEAILGVPPGDYATKQHVYDLWGGDGVVLGLRHRIGWAGDEGAIHVILNPEGSVSHKLWLDLWFIGEVTFLDKLRGWFGLRQKMNAVSSYPMPPDW